MMNDRKAAFAQAIIEGKNATQAALAAGYSEKTAGSQGHRLLKDSEISALIQQARQQAVEKTGVTAERVIAELAHQAFLDPLDFVDEKGAFRALKDIPPDARRQLASITIEAETETHGRLHKIRRESKTQALEMLARHFGAFEKDNEQAGESFADIVLAAQRRVRKDKP